MGEQEPVNRAIRLKDINERCRKMAEITQQRDEAKVIQLPLWPEGRGGSPNSFLRSALFAAIQGKDRIFMKDITLFSQQGYSVKFTGERLNQEDMTVWLALVDLARQHPLGTECTFTAYSILKHIGLGVGGKERDRLHANIKRLAACLVEVEGDRYAYGGSLIDDFAVDKQTKHYKVTLNKKLINIFGDNDWTALSWIQRKQLRNKPLAQKLHEYYSSHAVPKSVTVEFLYNITGSSNSQIRDFKRRLKAALDELVKIDFLKCYTVESNKVTVTRIHNLPVDV